MTPIHVNDPDDPRIAAFRDVKERDLTGRHGLFIAEGEVVLRVLASEASRCTPVSILIAEKRLEKLREVLERLPGDVPVHVASQAALNAVAGFDLHRGVLALGRKPEPVEPGALLDGLPERAVAVVACGIGNHDNMGGLFRNAAAFGAGAVLLDQTCCDPFYRKAIRVSVSRAADADGDGAGGRSHDRPVAGQGVRGAGPDALCGTDAGGAEAEQTYGPSVGRRRAGAAARHHRALSTGRHPDGGGI